MIYLLIYNSVSYNKFPKCAIHVYVYVALKNLEFETMLR